MGDSDFIFNPDDLDDDLNYLDSCKLKVLDKLSKDIEKLKEDINTQDSNHYSKIIALFSKDFQILDSLNNSNENISEKEIDNIMDSITEIHYGERMKLTDEEKLNLGLNVDLGNDKSPEKQISDDDFDI